MPQGNVRCTAANRRCARANYGLGCYHRMPHEHTRNCSVCCVLESGLYWCSFGGVWCKCQAIEVEEGE